MMHTQIQSHHLMRYPDSKDGGSTSLHWADSSWQSSCWCAISAWSAWVNPGLRPSSLRYNGGCQLAEPARSTTPSPPQIISPHALVSVTAAVKTVSPQCVLFWGFKKTRLTLWLTILQAVIIFGYMHDLLLGDKSKKNQTLPSLEGSVLRFSFKPSFIWS